MVPRRAARAGRRRPADPRPFDRRPCSCRGRSADGGAGGARRRPGDRPGDPAGGHGARRGRGRRRPVDPAGGAGRRRVGRLGRSDRDRSVGGGDLGDHGQAAGGGAHLAVVDVVLRRLRRRPATGRRRRGVAARPGAGDADPLRALPRRAHRPAGGRDRSVAGRGGGARGDHPGARTARRPGGRARSSVAPRLRRALVAGATGTVRLRPAASARGIEVVEYYGAAELSFVGVDDDGTGFTPFPQVGVELRGEQVWVRSAFTSLGYLPSPGLDPAAPLRHDDHGWASVGDRARPTADRQRFVLLGRPEAAVVGGVTVVLADVEAVLAEVPGVSDVACLAAPDAVLGEQVVAVLALDPAVELLDRHDLRRRSGAPSARSCPRPVHYGCTWSRLAPHRGRQGRSGGPERAGLPDGRDRPTLTRVSLDRPAGRRRSSRPVVPGVRHGAGAVGRRCRGARGPGAGHAAGRRRRGVRVAQRREGGRGAAGQLLRAGGQRGPLRGAGGRAGPRGAPPRPWTGSAGSGLEAVRVAAALVAPSTPGLVLAGGVESASTSPWRTAGRRRVRAGAGSPPRRSPIPTWGRPPTTSRADARCPGSGRTPMRPAPTGGPSRAAARPLRRRDGSVWQGFSPTPGPGRGSARRHWGASVRPSPPTAPSPSGNACGIDDGAAAVAVVDEATRAVWGLPGLRVVGSAVCGVDPAVPGWGAVPAARAVLDRAGLTIDDLELVEVTEAFAAQVLAATDALGLDPLGADADRVARTAARSPWATRGAPREPCCWCGCSRAWCAGLACLPRCRRPPGATGWPSAPSAADRASPCSWSGSADGPDPAAGGEPPVRLPGADWVLRDLDLELDPVSDRGGRRQRVGQVDPGPAAERARPPLRRNRVWSTGRTRSRTGRGCAARWGSCSPTPMPRS